MLALEPEARRLLIRGSGTFESCVLELANQLAEQQDESSINLDHVKLAIQSLATDNAFLRQVVMSWEGTPHVEKRAG